MNGRSSSPMASRFPGVAAPIGASFTNRPVIRDRAALATQLFDDSLHQQSAAGSGVYRLACHDWKDGKLSSSSRVFLLSASTVNAAIVSVVDRAVKIHRHQSCWNGGDVNFTYASMCSISPTTSTVQEKEVIGGGTADTSNEAFKEKGNGGRRHWKCGIRALWGDQLSAER